MNNLERKEMMNHRSQAIGHYIVYNKCTIKNAAKVFAVSTDTISDDINKRLKLINISLYNDVKKIANENRLACLKSGKAK